MIDRSSAIVIIKLEKRSALRQPAPPLVAQCIKYKMRNPLGSIHISIERETRQSSNPVSCIVDPVQCSRWHLHAAIDLDDLSRDIAAIITRQQ